jgi:hypothetical protein
VGTNRMHDKEKREQKRAGKITSAQPRGRPKWPEWAAAIESMARPRASLAALASAAVSTPVAVCMLRAAAFSYCLGFGDRARSGCGGAVVWT